MTIGCKTQSPSNVTMTNKIIWRFTSGLVDRKVNFRLATKLKQKAIDVETIFAATTDKPKKLNAKKIPKSIAVFALPTTTNRNFCELFFMATFVVFLNQIQRALFCFVKNPSDVFTYHTQ